MKRHAPFTNRFIVGFPLVKKGNFWKSVNYILYEKNYRGH